MLLLKCCRGKLTTASGSKFHAWTVCGTNECKNALVPANGCWSSSCLFVRWLWFGLVVITLAGKKHKLWTILNNMHRLAWALLGSRAIISVNDKRFCYVATVPRFGSIHNANFLTSFSCLMCFCMYGLVDKCTKVAILWFCFVALAVAQFGD